MHLTKVIYHENFALKYLTVKPSFIWLRGNETKRKSALMHLEK